MCTWRFLLLLLAVMLLLVAAAGLAAAQTPPEGNGLAASYPGDVGIESDPNVIFVEKFNEADLATMLARWDDTMRTDLMSLGTDIAPGSGDTKSLRVNHFSGDEGGYLYNNFPEGYDQVYVRYYTKFSDPSELIHHYVWLGGYNPPLDYPNPQAGIKPDGDDRFFGGPEPNGCCCTGEGDPVDGYAWRWDFYTYWMGMHAGGDGKYYGNGFMRNTWFPAVQSQWICVEFTIKLNNPVISTNGEMTFWINGQLLRKDGQIVSHLAPGTPHGDWGPYDWWIPNVSSPNTWGGSSGGTPRT